MTKTIGQSCQSNFEKRFSDLGPFLVILITTVPKLYRGRPEYIGSIVRIEPISFSFAIQE